MAAPPPSARRRRDNRSSSERRVAKNLSLPSMPSIGLPGLAFQATDRNRSPTREAQGGSVWWLLVSTNTRTSFRPSWRFRRRTDQPRLKLARAGIYPLFVSPLAKGEIQWGFWIPACAGMTIDAESCLFLFSPVLHDSGSFNASPRGQWPRLHGLDHLCMVDHIAGRHSESDLRGDEPDPVNACIQRWINQSQGRPDERRPQNGGDETAPESSASRW